MTEEEPTTTCRRCFALHGRHFEDCPLVTFDCDCDRRQYGMHSARCRIWEEVWMHTFTWHDSHQRVAVHLIDNRNTGMVKIVTEAHEDVQDEIELPAEAMEYFARILAGDKLMSLLEENGYV